MNKRIACLFLIVIFVVVGVIKTPAIGLCFEDSLITSLREGDFPRAKTLIKYGASKSKKNLLIESTYFNFEGKDNSQLLEMLRVILSKYDSKELEVQRNIDKLIRLHSERCINIYTQITKELLSKKLDLNSHDTEGFTPVHYAASDLYRMIYGKKAFEAPLLFSSKDMLSILKENGADLDIPGAKVPLTPIMISSYSGDLESVRYLLSQGVNTKRVITWGPWSNANLLDLAKSGQKLHNKIAKEDLEKTKDSDGLSIQLIEILPQQHQIKKERFKKLITLLTSLKL